MNPLVLKDWAGDGVAFERWDNSDTVLIVNTLSEAGDVELTRSQVAELRDYLSRVLEATA